MLLPRVPYFVARCATGDHFWGWAALRVAGVHWRPRDCRRRGLKRSWLAIMPLPSVLKLGLILQQHLWGTDLRVRCFAPEKLLTSVQWATRFAKVRTWTKLSAAVVLSGNGA